MTQIEKAQEWFKANGYESDSFDTELYVTVWNSAMEEPIDIHVSSGEIEYRAELWDNDKINNMLPKEKAQELFDKFALGGWGKEHALTCANEMLKVSWFIPDGEIYEYLIKVKEEIEKL